LTRNGGSSRGQPPFAVLLLMFVGSVGARSYEVIGATDPLSFRGVVAVVMLGGAMFARRRIRRNVRVCPRCGLGNAFRGPRDATCRKCAIEDH
jgi:hypothetical protein